jgi:hypothetical protein
MENNWEETAQKVIDKNNLITCRECICSNDDWLQGMLEAMNLVFEATKKECADKAECCEGAIVDVGFEIISADVNKESILNINKPNL